MPLFAVIVERGSAWNWSLPMRSQDQWNEHAGFMDLLDAEGFIRAGGPLGHEDRAPRILHVIDAADENAIRDRLAEDPWHRNDMLRIVDIEPWTVLLGRVGRQ
jgi:uncharacterized protein YciI